MEYRDYFERHIDQLGKVLSEIFSKVLGNGSGNAAIQLELMHKMLKEKANLDLYYLMDLTEDEVIPYLREDLNHQSSSFESLADLLDKIFREERRKAALKVALLLLKEVRDQNDTYSLEREDKIKALQAEIQLLG